MRLGVVILTDRRWSEASGTWRRAEALGFDHAWTYDHLTWSGLKESAWFGAIPTLTAAAMVTSRIRLGTLVASPNFRHPVPFAKELTSLDDISAGRLSLGIGAGAYNLDAAATRREPWPVSERFDRYEEFVELLDTLLREPVTTREGRFYSAFDVRNRPGCVQQPRIPFGIAGSGPRGMRLAARFGDFWITLGESGRDRTRLSLEAAIPILTDQVERLEAACAEVGRDPATLGRLLLVGGRITGVGDSVEAFRDAVGRLARLRFTDLVLHWPRSEEPLAGDEAMMERIAAEALPHPD